jgi:hypothetical protein
MNCSNVESKPIGGFFELEISKGKNSYHEKAAALTSARACLRLILKQVSPKKIYIPYYTCDALFQPLHLAHVDYELYPIDENLNPANLPKLKQDEWFLYINYFGIKTKTVESLIEKYGDRLIVDNVHDFFNEGYPGICSFNSARKYFGVPDGAYLYSPFNVQAPDERFSNVSLTHAVNRMIGRQNLAYKQFVRYRKRISSEILGISIVSEYMLSNIDYQDVISKRKANYLFLNEELKPFNHIKLNPVDGENPFCYPLLPEKPLQRELFWKSGFFIPSFWLDALKRDSSNFSIEKKLSLDLLPLPIDHRYDSKDLKRLCGFIRRLMS